MEFSNWVTDYENVRVLSMILGFIGSWLFVFASNDDVANLSFYLKTVFAGSFFLLAVMLFCFNESEWNGVLPEYSNAVFYIFLIFSVMWINFVAGYHYRKTSQETRKITV